MHVDEARARFAEVDGQLQRLFSKSDKGALTDGEFRKLEDLDSEAQQLADLIETRAAAKPNPGAIKPMPEPQISVGREEPTYRLDTRSYFADLYHAKFDQDFDALRRLQRHKEEVESTKESSCHHCC